VKTGTYVWDDKKKPNQTVALKLNLSKASQALHDEMKSLNFISAGQVLKAEVEEMMEVRA